MSRCYVNADPLYGQGELRNNLFQDVLSWGNAGLGFSFHSGAGFHANTGNNRIEHATFYGNGIDNPDGPWPGKYGGENTDAQQEQLDQITVVTNSYIENVFVDWPDYPNGNRTMNTLNGPGARLSTRYVDGVLTQQPLWPWPMDDRLQAELGFTATDLIFPLLNQEALNISVSPAAASIDPSESASFIVDITPFGNYTDTADIEIQNPNPSMLEVVNFAPTTVSPPARVEITVQDKHNPSFSDPVWFNVPVSVRGTDFEETVYLNLLINGKKVHLPLIFTPH